MKYITILFPVLLLALCGGNGAGTQGQESAASTQVADTTLPAADFYKSYTGTIAGQPVVLHLQRAGTVFSATYYYTQQGRPHSSLVCNEDARVLRF